MQPERIKATGPGSDDGALAASSPAAGIFDTLVATITSGAFSPGQKLSESKLARQLGVGRGPLREALGRLEGRLVTRVPHVGVRVIEIGRRDLAQLYLVREALEGMAARLAADAMTTDELAALGRLLDGHEAQPDLAAGTAYRQGVGDEDFHFAIVRGARCERLEAVLLDEIYFQLRIHRLAASARPGRAQAAFSEHREIVSALVARNPDAAEGTMRRHIRNARASALSSV